MRKSAAIYKGFYVAWAVVNINEQVVAFFKDANNAARYVLETLGNLDHNVEMRLLRRQLNVNWMD